MARYRRLFFFFEKEPAETMTTQEKLGGASRTQEDPFGRPQDKLVSLGVILVSSRALTGLA